MDRIAIGRIKIRKGKVVNEWVQYKKDGKVYLEMNSYYPRTERTFTYKEVRDERV